MLVEFETALRCDEAFNLLSNVDAYDELLDDSDPRANWERLIDRASHATWVGGYLDIHDRKAVADLFSEYRPRLQWRAPLGAGATSVEVVSPGIESNLRTTLSIEEAEYRAAADLDPELWIHSNGAVPRSREHYVAIAKEGLLDWFLRTSSPTFELRRCVYDGNWFIPQRAGRGRFCSDSCRARLNADDHTFTCAMCGSGRKRGDISGLRFRNGVKLEPPYDVEMEGVYGFSKREICIACILDQRPAWKRYVTGLSASDRRQTVQL